MTKKRHLRESYNRVLYIDDREPITFAELVAMNCTIPVVFKRMKTGDYVCEDVAIERKAIGDFASSIISKQKRLWKQLERLQKEFTYPYVLISGKLREVESDVTDHAMMGTMAYIACPNFDKAGIMIKPPMSLVKVDNSKQLAYLILKIMERHKKLKLLPVSEFQNI